MNFTLVSTVFNEVKRLPETIRDLEQQTLQPSEIIITDAGSTDGTYELLQQWKKASAIPIIILQKSKCNVAEGRNMAIRAAHYDFIASTDFGCRFHPQWLESIIAPFTNLSVEVVGGAFTVEEAQQNTLSAKAAYILSNGYRVDVAAPWFIPSSRSIAYKKYVFENIGGYCEWLTLATDDFIYGKEIQVKGYKVVMSDKPYVYWGRHKTAKGFIMESGRYGLGDGEAKVNFRNFASNFLHFALRVLFVLWLVFLFVNIFFSGIHLLPALCLFILAIGFRPYIGYIKSWLKYRSAKYNSQVMLYGFYLLEATRLQYIRSYIKGYFFASKHQKQEAKFLQQRLVKA